MQQLGGLTFNWKGYQDGKYTRRARSLSDDALQVAVEETAAAWTTMRRLAMPLQRMFDNVDAALTGSTPPWPNAPMLFRVRQPDDLDRLDLELDGAKRKTGKLRLRLDAMEAEMLRRNLTWAGL
jgi:hypothetical protein